MRIISLLAAATEIVCALDAGDMLVGRSHECDNPAWVRELPSCSEPAFDINVSSGEIDAEVRRRIRSGETLYEVNGERIRELRPDLVIAQAHCEVCAVTPGDVARGGGWAPEVHRLVLNAANLDGIFESVLQVALRLGCTDRGHALVDCLQQRLDRLRRQAAGFQRRTVAVIEWPDPLFAMGNWGPELVDIANGELLLGKKGEYSSPITPDQLLEADPEHIIVAPCGFDLPRTLKEKAVLERNPWWPELRAVRNGNVAFADGNTFFNRCGTTIPQTAEIVAEILHGIELGSRQHWRRA